MTETMNTRKLFAIGAAMTMLLTSVGFIAAQDDATTLRVAFIGAGNSSQADADRALYQAAVLAAQQINTDDDEEIVTEEGDRYALDIRYYEADSASEVVEAYNDAIDDGVVAILGPQDTEQLDELLDAESVSVALFTTANDSSNAQNVFELNPTVDDIAQAAADYLVEQRYFENIAVVAVDTETAQDAEAAFTTAAGSSNIAVSLTHASDADDMSSDAATIRDNDADALFIWSLDDQTVALLDELDRNGWNGEIFYAGLDNDFIQEAGAFAQNVYGALPWTATAYDDDSQQFVRDFADANSTVPANEAAAYYDAVELLAEAIREEGNNRTNIANHIRTMDSFDGVQGVYDQGETRDLLIVQSLDNRLTEVARYTDGECVNCLNTVFADVSATDTTNRESVTIALVGTLDGVNSAIGEAALQGAELAIREINDQGGILGPNNTRYILSLSSYSAETAAEMETAFQTANADGAVVVLGPDFNGQIVNQLGLAANQETAQIVSATSSEVTSNEVDDYVLQVRPNDAILGTSAVTYLIDERDYTRFATFAVRTDYGLDAINTVEQTIADSDDGQVVVAMEHEVDETDMSSYAEQIANANVEAVLVWSTQPAARNLLQALTDLNWSGTVVYGYMTPDFAETLAVSEQIELLAPVNWWSVASDWNSAQFTERYMNRYGEAPLSQSAAYYDAVFLVANALDAQGTDKDALQQWLVDQENFRGVQGVYDAATYGDGELSRSTLIIRLNSDGVQEMARYENGLCWVNCGS
jgi:branched-chain amino acid transport system substrate-binding protein